MENPLNKSYGQIEDAFLPAKRARDGYAGVAGKERLVAFLESQSGLGMNVEEFSSGVGMVDFLIDINPESREALYDQAAVSDEDRLYFESSIYKRGGKTCVSVDKIKAYLKQK